MAAFLDDDRSIGRAFIGVAAFGVVAAIVAGVAGLVMVGTLVDTGRRSLTLTGTAMEALDEAIAIARDTTGEVSDALDAAADGSVAAALAFVETAELLDTSSTVLTEDVPAAVEGVLDAMPGLQRTAAIIDGTLSFLSTFGVDYDPEVPFGEAIGAVAAGLEDLPAQLRSMDAPMRSLQARFESFSLLAADIGGDVRAIQASLGEARVVFDTIEEATAEGVALVDESESELGTQQAVASLAVIALAAALAAAQLVPLVMGLRLLRSAVASEPS